MKAENLRAPRRANVLTEAGGSERLIEDIRAYFEDHAPRWMICGAEHYLCLPHHRPFAFRPPTPHRRLIGRRRARAFYEETTTLLLSFLVGRMRPSVFLDVGSAQGYFSLVAATHLHAPSHVHAFEIQSNLVDQLKKRAAESELRSRIGVHHAALSDRHRGRTAIFLSRARMFEERPEPAAYTDTWWRRYRRRMLGQRPSALSVVACDVTSIDAFVQSSGAVPDIIKIDVEGYESKVIDGGAATFKIDKPMLLLELHRPKSLRFGETRDAIANRMFDHGYRALLFTDRHVKKRCEIVEVGPGDPLIARASTDLLLFYHPGAPHKLR